VVGPYVWGRQLPAFETPAGGKLSASLGPVDVSYPHSGSRRGRQLSAFAEPGDVSYPHSRSP